ncbi:MAG: hypothetical protein AB1760_19110 [Pseudomonadota bacterium]
MSRKETVINLSLTPEDASELDRIAREEKKTEEDIDRIVFGE